MTTALVPGANTGLTSTDLQVTIHLPAGATIDTSALLLGSNEKVRGDGDMCFFNQPSVAGGAVSMTTGPNRADYKLSLDRVDAGIDKIVLTATIDGAQTFGSLSALKLEAAGAFTAEIPTEGRTEKALILGEFYRRNGQWKYKSIAQGFNGGLAALATHYGVDIASPEPAPAAPPPPAASPAAPPAQPASGADSSVNLSKVSLTKAESSISLRKDDGRFGKIRINLNWNQKTKKGFLGFGSNAIDLDLACMIELNQGIGLVQALGNQFGAYDQPPFVRLLGDDRTGAATDGEWLEINGDQWQHFRRVLIYTFIYSGVANWQETDGMVRVLVPNQPEVEVRMNEYGSREPACAIVMLENTDGEIKVKREVTFHRAQPQIDQAYGFGFRWTAGRK